MDHSATGSEPDTLLDPLEYLPSSKVVFYKKNQIIYSQHDSATGVYLVIDGRVRVSRNTYGGNRLLVDIYRNDEFFGESVFAGQLNRTEFAVAHENASVMAWTVDEIQEIAARRHQLAIGLLQVIVRRSVLLNDQIESFATETIERRLARALIRFSERFGEQTDGGEVSMMALSHQLLSEYIGTSREIVTQLFNKFRRRGHLEYSRKGILLHGDGLKELLRRSAIKSSEGGNNATTASSVESR
jgi:CRP-like cAMP-binding protein